MFKVVYKEEAYFQLEIFVNSYKDVFLSKIIFWKKVSDTWDLSIIISIFKFRLFIDYSENILEKIRYIEKIEFFKK